MTFILLLVIVLVLAAIFSRKASLIKPQFDVRRGVFRLWFVLSALWIVFAMVVDRFNAGIEFIPPTVLGAILGGFVWIVEGFRTPKGEPAAGRRVLWVIANGLLFRFRLADDMIVTIPARQLTNDAMHSKDLASALHMWATGINGPLGSLSNFPAIRDYLYNWAIDRSRELGIGSPPDGLSADDRAVWLTPDRKAVWFWLPEGFSRYELIDVPFERFLQDNLDDNALLLDFRDWMTSSPTRAALSDHPKILAYLRQHTAEEQLGPMIQSLQQAKADGTLPPSLEKLLENDSSEPAPR